MLRLLIEALLWLQVSQAAHTAQIIHREAERRSIHPLLVAAVIEHETGGTWRRRLVSHTNDYGLMQVHVSRTMNRKYIGREHLLFSPRRNIRLGVRILSFWHDYHVRHCKKDDHDWWSHYKWGSRVRNNKYGDKVKRIYLRLLSRFVHKRGEEVACLLRLAR
jgi:hypothetical protein